MLAVVFGNRVVMPASLHAETLAKLHESHQGIEKTRVLALVWGTHLPEFLLFYFFLFIKTYLYRVVHNQTILILFYSVALFLVKSKSRDN